MGTQVVGIDLGGTKVAAAQLDGTALAEAVIEPTELGDAEALLAQLAAIVDRARGERLDAVGIGVPSVVEFATGRVVSSVNIPLTDVPLREVLGERLGVPVFVDNDATVAGLAEAHDHDLRLVAQDLVMLTVGTGVGGGLVLGGRIYRGASGGAGELGHTLGRGVRSAAASRAASRVPAPWRRSPPGTRWTGWAGARGGTPSARRSTGTGWPGKLSGGGPSGSASAWPTRSTRSIRRRW